MKEHPHLHFLSFEILHLQLPSVLSPRCIYCVSIQKQSLKLLKEIVLKHGKFNSQFSEAQQVETGAGSFLGPCIKCSSCSCTGTEMRRWWSATKPQASQDAMLWHFLANCAPAAFKSHFSLKICIPITLAHRPDPLAKLLKHRSVSFKGAQVKF